MESLSAQFESMPEESVAPETPGQCIEALREGPQRLVEVKKRLRRRDTDEQWIDEFVEEGGLELIWDILESCVQYPQRSKTTAVLKCIECTKAVCAKPSAMNYFISANLVIRLVNTVGLRADPDYYDVKIHLFFLLSSITRFSPSGFEATMTALKDFQEKYRLKHQFSLLVQELKILHPEYQATIMAFINYLVASCQTLDDRVNLRSSLSALQLDEVLAWLSNLENLDETLLDQLKIYQKLKESDEEELETPGGIKLNEIENVSKFLVDKFCSTVHASALLGILQKLLVIDRDSLKSGAIFLAIQKFIEAAVCVSDPSQMDDVQQVGLERLKKAVQDEETRLKTLANGERSLTPQEPLHSSLSDQNGDPLATNECSSTSPIASPLSPPVPSPQLVPSPPPAPPPPPMSSPPPPPPPPFKLSAVNGIESPDCFECQNGGVFQSVQVTQSIYDQAREHRPKLRMKKLRWEKIDGKNCRSKSALWFSITCTDAACPVKMESVQESAEELFSIKSRKPLFKGAPVGGVMLMPIVSTPKKVHLPNQNKALNISIVLNTLRRKPEEVVEMIRKGESERFTLHQAALLHDQLPDKSDLVFLESHEKDQSLLGPPELFLLELKNLPMYEVRMEVLKVRIIFRDLLNDYVPVLTTIKEALEELMVSSTLKEIMFIILIIGNIINGGTDLGKAYGFRIDSLQNLTDTCANKPKTNLMHYLVTVCDHQCPHLLKLTSEFKHLESASKFSFQKISNEIKEWKEKIWSFKRVMESTEAPPVEFMEQLNAFIPNADDKLAHLAKLREEILAKSQVASEYFCDSRDNFIEHVFQDIWLFVDKFQKTVKVVQRYKPFKLPTERSGEKMSENDDLPSAIAAIVDEDLDFETPPEYASSEDDFGQRVPLSIPGEEEEFFSLYPISLRQQQYELPPTSLDSQDSVGPYYSIRPDQSILNFSQSHYGPHFDRLSSHDQQPKSLGGALHRFQSTSTQPHSLSVTRMQSSNISGVRRILQNMARAITKELHLD